ncbi:MAG: hypothetical protein AW07_04774 [Candidatus Accumulibacter sp. SK-11]|nr:MAG: hypothetical protein AW07_04774 [Candidatus Accumulibacter sp. SK-11]
MAALPRDGRTVLVRRSEVASQGAAGLAGPVAAGPHRSRCAVQSVDGGVHFGTGGQGPGEVLERYQEMPRRAHGGRTDLCVLLLCAGQARSALAALVDRSPAWPLLRQAGLLQTERQCRDRQPGSARCRGHPDLHPGIAPLPAGGGGRNAAAHRLQRRSLVHFTRNGRFSDHLCDCRHRGHPTGVRTGPDRAQLLSTQTRSRFPLQSGAHSRKCRGHCLLSRRGAGVAAGRPVFRRGVQQFQPTDQGATES